MGLAILGPLRELDEVAYLRFASVYRGFESLADFEDEISALRHGAATGGRGADGTPSVLSSPDARAPATNHHRDGPGRPARDPARIPEGGRHDRDGERVGARGGKGARKGLTIRRIHTREGVHPYDEVTWERRDVVMTNWRDGSVNFEQHGVEFPDFWSVNAANIVTTKYFRGAVGTPQREWSLKQLVDRVVGTYVAAGREHGYFATAKDAEIFDHELTYALIHQIFAFNSPVWFNVGTTSPQQVSARASHTTRWSAPRPAPSPDRRAGGPGTPSAPRSTTPTALPGSSRPRPTA